MTTLDWNRSNRIENEYRRAITALYSDVIEKLKGETDPQTIARKLREISRSPSLHEYAAAQASKMTTRINQFTAKTWRTAAREAGRGSEIYACIMRSLKESPDAYLNIIQNNAQYIRSVPKEAADWIVLHMQQESLKGRRSSDITSDILKQYPNLLKNRAKLIARTEVSKAQTALTQSRAQQLGLDWYIWRSAEDGRVRNSHQKMHGMLIRWSDAPNPEKLFPERGNRAPNSYHAGNFYNCRCYPEPVVNWDYVDFPIRVHHKGKISNMTKAKFKRLIT